MAYVLSRFLLLLVFTWSLPASAYVLGFIPNTQSVQLGGQASVVVRVAGVRPYGLGNYDLDVLYDPTILAFDRALDHMGLGSAIGLGVSDVPGRVTLSDFSLEWPSDLLASQPDSFPLLTLVFKAQAVGTSFLEFDFVNLGDVYGDTVTLIDAPFGSITVNAASIPEPGSLMLITIGGVMALIVLLSSGHRWRMQVPRTVLSSSLCPSTTKL